MSSNVTIKSDGTFSGTRVEVNGVLIRGITKVYASAEPDGVVAVLVVRGPALDVEAPVVVIAPEEAA